MEVKNNNNTTAAKKSGDASKITRQRFFLAGRFASNANKPNHETLLLPSLAENNKECVCSEVVDGESNFIIVIKSDQVDNSTTENTASFKRVAGVSYMTRKEDTVMVERYLVGDHTDKDSATAFFKEVQSVVSKNAAHRGWSISEQGELTKSKPKYFF